MFTRSRRLQGIALFVLLIPVLTGCTSLRNRVPARSIRPTYFDKPRSSLQPINFIRLRQDPPTVYQLAPRDILGIYIEGMLGEREGAPPVHFPEDADVPPSIGYPIPVREDGTLSLPLVPPIDVSGLSLAQAERLIRKAYTVDQEILQPGRDRIIVTLMRPRRYNVLVVREDTSTIGTGGGAVLGTTKRGAAHAVELRAYENDVLHALSESGGLPGVDAKNEITILRGEYDQAKSPTAYFTGLLETHDGSPFLPDIGGEVLMSDVDRELLSAGRNVVKISLRTSSGEPEQPLTQDDIILNTGDIVFIESREAEVFYSGGLLGGGQHLLPRDYDLDVLGAIAMAGGSVAPALGSGGSQGGGFGGGGGGGIGVTFPPTRIRIVRTFGGRQITICTNIKRCIRNPKQRILIQPEDIVMLEYTECEMILNILLSNIQFNYFLNRNGSGGF